MDIFQHPRYKDRPVLLFFEKYILQTLGLLPAEKSAVIQSLGLQAIFGTTARDWSKVVEEVLRLSNTIDITIWSEWLNYQDQCESANIESNADNFSRLFADRYFDPMSTLDVWTDDSLESAKDRINSKRHEVEA